MYYLLFDIELWASMLILLVITILVRKHLREEIRKTSISKFNKSLKYYPLALIVLWIFPSIDLIVVYEEKASTYEVVFSYLAGIAFGVQGLVNFRLYGYGYIRKALKKRFKLDYSQNNLLSIDNYYPQQQEQSLPCTKLLIRELDEKSNNSNINEVSDVSPLNSEDN